MHTVRSKVNFAMLGLGTTRKYEALRGKLLELNCFWGFTDDYLILRGFFFLRLKKMFEKTVDAKRIQQEYSTSCCSSTGLLV